MATTVNDMTRTLGAAPATTAAPPPPPPQQPQQPPVTMHTQTRPPVDPDSDADSDDDVKGGAEEKEVAEFFRTQLNGSMVLSARDQAFEDCFIQATHANKYTWLTPSVLSVHMPGDDNFVAFKAVLDKLIRDGKFAAEGSEITIQGDFNCDLANNAQRTAFLDAFQERDLIITDLYTPGARVNKERSKNPCENSQVGKCGTPTITAKDAAVTATRATPVEKLAIALLMQVTDVAQQDSLARVMGRRVQTHLEHVRTLQDLGELPVMNFPRIGENGLMKDHLASYSFIRDEDGQVIGIVATDNVIKSTIDVNDLYDQSNAMNKSAVQIASKRLADFQWRYLARTLLTEEQIRAIFGATDINNVLLNSDARDLNAAGNAIMYPDPENSGDEISGITLRTKLEAEIKRRWQEMFPATEREAGAPNREANIARHNAGCKAIAEAFYTAAHGSAEFTAYNGLLNEDKQYTDAMKAEVRERNTGLKGLDSYLETPVKMMNYFFMGGLRQPDLLRQNASTPAAFMYPLNVQPFGGFELPARVDTQEEIDKYQAENMLEQYQADIAAGRLRNGVPILIMNLKECGANSHSDLFYKLVEQIMRLSATTGLQNVAFERDVLGPVQARIADAARAARAAEQEELDRVEAEALLSRGVVNAATAILKARYAPQAANEAEMWGTTRDVFLITAEQLEALKLRCRLPALIEQSVERLYDGEPSFTVEIAAQLYAGILENGLMDHREAVERQLAEVRDRAEAARRRDEAARRRQEDEDRLRALTERTHDALADAVELQMFITYAPAAADADEAERTIMAHFLITAEQREVIDNQLAPRFEELVTDCVNGLGINDARNEFVGALQAALVAHKAEVEARIARQRAEAEAARAAAAAAQQQAAAAQAQQQAAAAAVPKSAVVARRFM